MPHTVDGSEHEKKHRASLLGGGGSYIWSLLLKLILTDSSLSLLIMRLGGHVVSFHPDIPPKVSSHVLNGSHFASPDSTIMVPQLRDFPCTRIFPTYIGHTQLNFLCALWDRFLKIQQGTLSAREVHSNGPNRVEPFAKVGGCVRRSSREQDWNRKRPLGEVASIVFSQIEAPLADMKT